MPYTAKKPNTAHPREVLESSVVGWGVDLDPANRPGVPKERFNPNTGAHWTMPEHQVAGYEREKSTEHAMVPPVFGTSCPPRGLSGVIRRLAYKKFSEGQSAHWLLLMLGDRIDVLESNIGAIFRGRPDNFFSEMGLGAEFRRHGLRSRIGRGRNDLKHLPVDVIMFAGKLAIAGGAAYGIARLVRPKKKLTLWSRLLG
jgi:hypothetical protein